MAVSSKELYMLNGIRAMAASNPRALEKTSGFSLLGLLAPLALSFALPPIINKVLPGLIGGEGRQRQQQASQAAQQQFAQATQMAPEIMQANRIQPTEGIAGNILSNIYNAIDARQSNIPSVVQGGGQR